MSSDENKAIVIRFGQVWSTGELELVDELASPDMTVAYPLLPEELHSADAFKQVLVAFRAAFRDLKGEFDEPIAEGDRVAVRWTLQGEHRGDLFGIPATNKTVRWSGISIYRLAGGKVVEERGEEDALGLLRQLGVIPMPAEAAG
jgi:steroid delta-isomerase-like uncharacterized protein